MFVDSNTLNYKQIQDFEKYARFICETFDINIQMEASKAETDGKTIYLPNILSLTSKELDMMYSILLHEAGHIRYTSFKEDDFAKIKTKYHAYLSNSIEDARIENLLIQDFGGGQEIFTKLYSVYAEDKKLMKKVFNFENKKPDLFIALGIYTHNLLVNCQTADIEKICGKFRARILKKFFEKNDFYNLLSTHPLNNWDDVIDLTNTIFNAFIKHHRDSSEKISANNLINCKNEAQKLCQDVANNILKKEQEKTSLEQELLEVQQELDDFLNNHSETMNNLKKDITSSHSQKERVREELKNRKDYQSLQNKINQLPSKIQALEDKLSKLNNDTSALSQQITNKRKIGSERNLTPIQLEKMEKSYQNKTEQLNKAEKDLTEYQQALNENRNKISGALNKLSTNFSSLSDEELDEQLKAINNSIDKYKSELSELENNLDSLEKKGDSLEDGIEKIEKAMKEAAAQMLFKLEDTVKDQGLDIEIMPPLNYQESWPEAADVQNNFDKKATKESGKIIRNGGRVAGQFGSNVRDIILFIDKKKEQIKEIDVTEFFKDQIVFSKFSSFDNKKMKTNQREDISVSGIYGTTRKHLPLTTMFDSIVQKNNTAKSASLQKMLQENKAFIQAMKQVFAKKFNFAKKDYWSGGQEEGNLDVRNLWKLPTKLGDDYFEINRPRFINKVAASILVDISGSNDKDITEHGEKIKLITLALSEALEHVHIQHEVLGYHAPLSDEMRQMASTPVYTRRSNKLETVVYKNFQQKDRAGLMNMELQMTDNSDGESLRIASQRLLRQRAKSHLLFIIGDGKPFLSDTDMSVLDQDFKNALLETQKNKIHVYGISFFEQAGCFFDNNFAHLKNEFDLVKFFDTKQN